MIRVPMMARVAALCLVLGPPVSAVEAKEPSQPPAFTPQREAVAVEFVKQHHSELTAVLKRLKAVSRVQYEQAIGDLFEEADRITRVKTSDEELHDLMLKAWKVQSRIQVLAARLTCLETGDEKLEQQLKDLIRERVGCERQMMEHRRKRLAESLENVEANLRWFEEKSDQIAERRFEMLLRSTQRQRVQEETR